MIERKTNFLELLKEKRYSLIVSIIENKISEKDKTPGLLNLCGVARMLSDKSNEVIRLAIKDFKDALLNKIRKIY